jgi:hypothetical protein
MTCQHLWLPSQRKFWRCVTCTRCGETRHVRWRWRRPEPRTNGQALGEAIDRGVIDNDEVTWGGQRLR